ncbi:MAG TPA: hypothetical protein VM452_17275 [Caulifigura sp.]|jgi:hypothetical protein|nr:hypothetical protein [Caulifigura sp.]
MNPRLEDALSRPNGLPPLWNQLISLRLESAAIGMLHDVFQGVAYGEAKMRGRLGQMLHAGIREEAMDLIGDTDGTLLKVWLDAFRYDRLQFQRMAIEHVRGCCNSADSNE